MMALNKQLENDLGNGVFCTVHELFFEGQKSPHVDLHRVSRMSVLGSGSKRSKVRGRGMEFYESRPYVPQDEMRTIDWKVSARFSKLFTKIFIEERDRPVYVAVDLRRSMFFGSRTCFKSVMAARIAARLAIATSRGGDQLSGIMFDHEKDYQTPLSNSRKNLARWFGMLAEGTKKYLIDQVSGPMSWPIVLKSLSNRIKPGAIVFLLSDFLEDHGEIRHQLFKLKRHSTIFAISIFDPLEEQIPALGSVGLAYEGQRIVFDSNDVALKRRYETWWQQQQNQVADVFHKLGIPQFRICTTSDPDIELRRIFLGQW